MSYRIQLPLVTEGATDAQTALLEAARAKLGFVPNMYRGMVTLPGYLQAYVTGYEAFRATSGFDAAEQEVVFLTVSVANRCTYCVAAHSTIADMSGVSTEVTDAARDDRPVPVPRLEALRRFVLHAFEARGWLSEDAVAAFKAAGYGEHQILAVDLAIATKTLSNYANHLFLPALDGPFRRREWSPR